MVYIDFLPFCRLSFHFLDNVPWYTLKYFILMKSNFICFFFGCMWSWCQMTSKNQLPNPSSLRFTPMFSPKFYAALKCVPLVYFELIFFIWCEVMVQLHSFAVVPAPFPFFSPSEFFFFLDWLSWFTIFSKFQVYNIVVYNFKRLYSIYSYDKNIGYVPCQHHFLKRLFFPHRLGSLVENQLTIDVWVYLWTFYSIPWINICPYASTTLFWSL